MRQKEQERGEEKILTQALLRKFATDLGILTQDGESYRL